jgi:hypothetical protein
LPVAERGGDLMLGRRLADQAFDDGRAVSAAMLPTLPIAACGLPRSIARRRQPFVQLRLEPLVGRLGLGACCSRVALAIDCARRARRRAPSRRRMRRVRLLLEAIRRRKIVGDALAALGEDRRRCAATRSATSARRAARS